MIRIQANAEDLRITCNSVVVNKQILNLGEEKNKQIADAINSLHDDSGHKVAFLFLEGGKVKFFRDCSARNEPVFIRGAMSQLLDDLKFVELEVIRKWDELFPATQETTT